MRAGALYVRHNHGLEAAAQIEIFQPDQVALGLSPSDNGLDISKAGEDGRNKAGGANTGIMKSFHGRQPPLNRNGFIHIFLEIRIQRVD